MLDDEYGEWLDRVRATYEAVAYTCAHRLRDAGLAEQVAVQVVAGLVARPAVFRYFGLPYSGRIASLAEDLIAAADAGTLGVGCAWADLRERLVTLPEGVRAVLVAVCVRGVDLAELGAELGCDERAAADRREAMFAAMRAAAAPAMAAAVSGGGEG